MNKMSKLINLIILAGLMFGAVSCFKEADEPEVINYTPEREAGIISDFIALAESEGIQMDTTDMGVFYVIFSEEEQDGALVQDGDSLGIIYRGYFPDNGLVFDQSSYWYEEGIWKFTFPTPGLIPGFNDAIAHLKEGDEGLFLIPSHLAYGVNGSGSIPPYSPLVFEIELKSIYEE
ncbi:FKBP-type peptidyl-prolyl cis-trans isomerase [Prolixibacteraceae bacterium A06]|uniref:Peptidyl-prolyl cis-trans isomerase n=2 Tax=Gaoshiqia sediminis TaxID=2986998 RepID=A0AA42C9L8_9BACT|nr:FKBP-type peptidyl-prolyl cis-trans isomerase [Gaoshiqia sediminis]